MDERPVRRSDNRSWGSSASKWLKNAVGKSCGRAIGAFGFVYCLDPSGVSHTAGHHLLESVRFCAFDSKVVLGLLRGFLWTLHVWTLLRRPPLIVVYLYPNLWTTGAGILAPHLGASSSSSTSWLNRCPAIVRRSL